jgi:hypothetical protein
MPTSEKRQTQETEQVQQEREKKLGSDVLTEEKTPSYGFGFTLGAVFLLLNLLVAAIYFKVINP